MGSGSRCSWPGLGICIDKLDRTNVSQKKSRLLVLSVAFCFEEPGAVFLCNGQSCPALPPVPQVGTCVRGQQEPRAPPPVSLLAGPKG